MEDLEQEEAQLGFKERAAAKLSAGGLAAMVGHPADLTLIRMQSDNVESKRGARGITEALAMC